MNTITPAKCAVCRYRFMQTYIPRCLNHENIDGGFVDYVYKHCYWNSLDVHDIVKRVIEFKKTLKNMKKAEMKFEQCYIDF